MAGAAGEATGALAGVAAALGAVVAVVAVVAAAIAVVVGLTKNAIKVSQQGDEIAKAAKKAGFTAEQYQLWSGVLKDFGISASSFSTACNKLRTAQGNAIKGTESTAKAFEKLGISQKELAEMDNQKLFQNTILALQNVENQVDRNIIANELFGKSYSELMPLLNSTNGETYRLLATYDLLGGTMSNKCAAASEQLQDAIAHLKYAFQGLKFTLAETIIPVLAQIVSWFARIIAYASILLKAILGIDLKTSAATTNATSGVSSYASSLKGATKAAQELKRTTQGFDELNIVQNPNKASSGVGDSGGGDYGGSIGDTSGLTALDEASLEKIDKFREKIDSIKDILQTAFPVIGGILLFIFGLSTGNIPLAIAGAKLLQYGINIGIENGFWENRFGGIIEAAKNLWSNISEIWEKIKAWKIWTTVGTALNNVKDKLTNWWSNVKAWFNDKVKPKFTKEYWKEKFDTIKTSIGEKLNEVKTKATEKWDAIKNWFNEKIKPKFTKEYWLGVFDKIKTSISTKLTEAKNSITDKWTSIKTWFDEKVKPKFTLDYWKTKFGVIGSAISTKLGEAKTYITNKWTEVKTWFNEKVKPKFTSEYWKSKFDGIRAGVSEKIGAAKKIITDAWTSIKTWFNNNVASKFTTTYWSNKFGAIRDGMKSALNGLIGKVESAVNNIVKKINSVGYTIPDWIPVVGGKRIGISLNTVYIPRLAKGGIVDGATTFIAGENGKEAIIPLENNTEWIDKLAEALSGKASSPTKLVLKVGERELGYAVIDSLNGITKTTGSLPLYI